MKRVGDFCRPFEVKTTINPGVSQISRDQPQIVGILSVYRPRIGRALQATKPAPSHRFYLQPRSSRTMISPVIRNKPIKIIASVILILLGNFKKPHSRYHRYLAAPVVRERESSNIPGECYGSHIKKPQNDKNLKYLGLL